MTNSKIIVFLFAILVPSAILAASVKEEHNIQKRSLGTCNFFQEAGIRCTSCNVVRACLPFDIAVDTTCDGLLPYCRNGHCSMFRGAMCDTTSTSTTTAGTPTTSTTSTSTTTTTTTPMPET